MDKTKCCICEKEAVLRWPVCDPDIPTHAYCRKCMDEIKERLLKKFKELDKHGL